MHQATHHLHPTSYITLFNNMSNFMKKPNIIIHLDVTPEESLRRIKMRSRDCESSVSLEYLVELRAAYDDFIKQISLVIPVIKVNWSDFRSADVRDKPAHPPHHGRRLHLGEPTFRIQQGLFVLLGNPG